MQERPVQLNLSEHCSPSECYQSVVPVQPVLPRPMEIFTAPRNFSVVKTQTTCFTSSHPPGFQSRSSTVQLGKHHLYQHPRQARYTGLHLFIKDMVPDFAHGVHVCDDTTLHRPAQVTNPWLFRIDYQLGICLGATVCSLCTTLEHRGANNCFECLWELIRRKPIFCAPASTIQDRPRLGAVRRHLQAEGQLTERRFFPFVVTRTFSVVQE